MWEQHPTLPKSMSFCVQMCSEPYCNVC
jgi:hypothetical protein